MTSGSVDPSVTSDDKLWAALAYLFSPFVPIIILLLDDKKERPFIKAHYAQSLVFGIIFWGITSVLSFVIIGLCLVPIGLLLEIFWAYQAYQGKMINIPVVSDFVKNQGWA